MLFLLTYMIDPALQQHIRAETTKVEAYHHFTDWLAFGSPILRSGDPVEQEKRIKYRDLVANAVMLHNVVDMTKVLAALQQEGVEVTPEVAKCLSPYLTEHLKRFGQYMLDITVQPEPLRPNGSLRQLREITVAPFYTYPENMPGMHREASIEIHASPEAVYDLVSDLPRMGEWSPENIGGEWQGGGSGKVGDRFIGHNRAGERTWSAPVMVTQAERGRCFAFVIGPDDGPYVRWTYRLEPSGTGTRVTEVWDVEKLPPALQSWTQAQLDERARYTEGMLTTTLAALKATAEG